MNKVNVEDKVLFIRWLLKNHTLKRREVAWILNYLTVNPKLLENVIFTDEVHLQKRAIVFSTNNTDNVAFRFYKGSLMTSDVEKSFHDIRINNDEKIYLQVNFPEKFAVLEYVVVHEEVEKIEEPLDLETIRLVKEIEFSNNMKTVRNEIDEALDTNNMNKFMKMWEILEELKRDSVIY